MSHWSEKYLGVPFEDGANGPDTFDCWGFVVHVMRKEFNAPIPDYNYSLESVDGVDGAAARRTQLIDALRPDYVRIPSPVEGAMALLYIRGRRPHIGVCTSERHLLHMTKGLGAVIIDLDKPKVQHALEGYYLPASR